MDFITQRRPGVTIETGPKDWQILQRDKEGFAEIKIEGSYLISESRFSVQARIVNEADGEPVTRYLDWNDAEIDEINCTFKIILSKVPQGGLYIVQTRVRRPFAQDKRALRGDCIHHIGVGDIYIIAGQSNSSGTGKGSAMDSPVLGVHLFANDEKWKLAAHPLEDATNSLHPITITGIFHGSSPWLAFGRKLLLRTGVPVGLIPTALGGCPISMWVTKEGFPGLLFKNMQEMMEKAGGKIAGVLWYQGETDAFNNQDNNEQLYFTAFNQFVKMIRELADNIKLPIITAQLNSFKYKTAQNGFSEMRELQRKISYLIDYVYMVVTIDANLSDEIHNDSISNVRIGERFADVVLENSYKMPINSKFPELKEAVFLNAEKRNIRLKFDNIQGDWTPIAEIEDFSVEGEGGFVKLDSVEIMPDNSIVIKLDKSVTGKSILHCLYGNSPNITLKDDGARCLTPSSQQIATI